MIRSLLRKTTLHERKYKIFVFNEKAQNFRKLNSMAKKNTQNTWTKSKHRHKHTNQILCFKHREKDQKELILQEEKRKKKKSFLIFIVNHF
jgi:hypothetical protein